MTGKMLVPLVVCAALGWSQQPVALSLSANGQTELTLYGGWPLLLEASAFLVGDQSVVLTWPDLLRITIQDAQGRAQTWPLETLDATKGPVNLGENQSASAVWGMSGEATGSIAAGDYVLIAEDQVLGASRRILLTVAAGPASPTPDQNALKGRLESRYREFKGDLEGALAILDQSLQGAANDVGLLAQKADLLEEMGRIEESVVAEQKALTAFRAQFPHPTEPPRGLTRRLDELLAEANAAVGPQISAAGIVNAATSVAGGIAPNEFISIYGTGLGPSSGGYSGPMTDLAAGTQVYIGGTLAPIVYSSATQVNVLAPFAIAGTASATVQVACNGVKGNAVAVPVAGSSPGIFTQTSGPGQAWVLNQDGTFNSSTSPAVRNAYITFWATGQGSVDITQQDGKQPTGPPFPAPLLPVSVSLGGVKVPDNNVVFRGMVYSGEIQLNMLVPADAATGNAVSLVLTIGGASSRDGVTLAIK